MDIKKKLMELLSPTSLNFEQATYLADYLVKNGVTVQEWISVNDRLPEPTYCVLVVGAYSEMAIDALGTDGEWMGMVEDITHWMPLPAPPKEKERKDGDGNV